MIDLFEVQLFRHGAWHHYVAVVMPIDALKLRKRLHRHGYTARILFRGEVWDG